MSAEEPAAQAGTVVCETVIAAPVERVFDALTDPQQILAWWVNEPFTKAVAIDMDPRPGGRWRFQWRTSEGVDYGAIGAQLRRNGKERFEAWGEIIECARPRLLVWSWSASWHADPSRVTIVRWDLEATGGGTRVRVTHSGLQREGVAETDDGGGWRQVLALVRSFVEM
jgi:uncharacterized protein YndB with AHSA1/START domain